MRRLPIERDLVDRAKADGSSLAELTELRLEERRRRSRPVLERLFNIAFTLDEDPAVARGSRLQKAVTYLINQRKPLLAHLDHGEIPIHNNDTERDLRHAAVGRKNWMIFGSQRGGEVAARLYSLVLSCKLNDVDVEAYLEDVLGLISTETDVARLTPWAWAGRPEAHAAE